MLRLKVDGLGRGVGLGEFGALGAQPVVQFLGDGFGVLLAQQSSRLGVEFLGRAFDLVELGDEQHGVVRDGAAVEFVHLEEFSPGVRHAQRRRDALLGQRVIAREVVRDERSRKVFEHTLRVVAAPREAEVVEHRAVGREVGAAVDPHVGPLGFAPAGSQQADRS